MAGEAASTRGEANGKRIQQRDVKPAEVAEVGCPHRQLMDLGDGANHRVFIERVGFAMHQLGPGAEGGAIHREDVEGVAHPN